MPFLSTARLHLRQLRAEDAPAISAYRSLPEIARYQSWQSFDLEDAAELIRGQMAVVANIPGTWLQLGIVETATNSLSGDCGLHFSADNKQVELGITFAPDFQRRGYAAEIIRGLLHYILGELDKHRVFAVTDAMNAPAAALFRRLGFRREAHFVENVWFKGRWSSEFVFALLKSEWEGARQGS